MSTRTRNSLTKSSNDSTKRPSRFLKKGAATAYFELALMIAALKQLAGLTARASRVRRETALILDHVNSLRRFDQLAGRKEARCFIGA